MLICNCALAGTKACLSCPAYQEAFGDNVRITYVTDTTPAEQKAKRVTVEEYDGRNKLIKRTITTEEVI